MSTISIGRRGANTATVQLDGNYRPKSRSISPVMHVARSLWPRKTAAELAEITGVSLRTAERWLAGERALSTAALAALIRSEHGLDFLVAVMADAEPAWWRRVNAYFAAIDAQRLQRAARRKLREAIDADTALSDDIRRADALLVQDEDFYRGQADALRAAARVPNRPLARKRRNDK
jgi:hypothetical protein